MDIIQASWLMTAASSSTHAQEDSIRHRRMLFIFWNRTNFSNRTLIADGPRVWNYLPTNLRQPDLSYCRFRQSLKTIFGTKVWCESPFNCTLIILLLTLLTLSLWTWSYDCTICCLVVENRRLAFVCRKLKVTQTTMACFSWRRQQKRPATWTRFSWR